MLPGRVAVVTGGAAGIGRAVAERLCREGAAVVIADLNPIAGRAAVDGLAAAGHRAVFVPCDVADAAQVGQCMNTAVERFGRLDVLVNNACCFEFGHLAGEGGGSGTGLDRAVTEDAWMRTLRTNVLGYAKCIEAAVPHMRRNDPAGPAHAVDEGRGPNVIHAGSRGSIVNVASVSGFIAQPEFVPYNASKGAILQLTRCCAMDLAKFKIRVNAVAPGTVETGASYHHMDLLGLGLEQGRWDFGNSCLLRRQAAPAEIANGVAFLASDEASFMTGATLVMDGGGTI